MSLVHAPVELFLPIRKPADLVKLWRLYEEQCEATKVYSYTGLRMRFPILVYNTIMERSLASLGPQSDVLFD